MVEFSVNQAIERLSILDGTVVNVYGALSLEFEGRCIMHTPRSEILSERSSIWADFDQKAIGQPEEWFKQFESRSVCVTGVISGPEFMSGGCGHFSMWPVAMVITAIQKK